MTNPSDQLGGLWADDQNSITGLPKTSGTNTAGPKNTYTDLAAEAARAAAHFHITDLANANIVIAQPANYSDPNAVSTGYCAFHNYTYPGEPTVTPIPGALNDIKGNHGGTFAVRSLWSNQAAAGTGYCAGAGNDLPQPIPAQ